MGEEPRLLTIREAAIATGRKQTTIRGRVERGALRTVKHDGKRFIPVAELERAGLLEPQPATNGHHALPYGDHSTPVGGLDVAADVATVVRETVFAAADAAVARIAETQQAAERRTLELTMRAESLQRRNDELREQLLRAESLLQHERAARWQEAARLVDVVEQSSGVDRRPPRRRWFQLPKRAQA